jgi:hypothetical protein
VATDTATFSAARDLFRSKLGLSGKGLPFAVTYLPRIPPQLVPPELIGIVNSQADTIALPPGSRPKFCLIVVLPGGQTLQGQDRRYVLAHEAFHCVVDELGLSLPHWLNEGLPTWAACSFAPGAATPTGWYNTYVTSPDVASTFNSNPVENKPELFSRGYSATGFFSLLETSGIDVWSRLLATMRAGNGGNSLAAYQTVVAGDEQQVLDGWASSYFRMPARGSDWDVGGLCPPDGSLHVNPHEVTIAKGSSTPVSSEALAVKMYHLNVASDVDLIHIRVDAGQGSLRINGGAVDDNHVTDAYYCTASDQCMCPKGESYTGPDFTVLASDPTTLVAVTGGQSGLTGTVTAIQKECGPPPPPPPPGTVPPPPPPGPGSYSATLDYHGTWHEVHDALEGAAVQHTDVQFQWDISGVVADVTKLSIATQSLRLTLSGTVTASSNTNGANCSATLTAAADPFIGLDAGAKSFDATGAVATIQSDAILPISNLDAQSDGVGPCAMMAHIPFTLMNNVFDNDPEAWGPIPGEHGSGGAMQPFEVFPVSGSPHTRVFAINDFDPNQNDTITLNSVFITTLNAI